MTWHYLSSGPSLIWSGLRVILIGVAVAAFCIGLLLIMIESDD